MVQGANRGNDRDAADSTPEVEKELDEAGLQLSPSTGAEGSSTSPDVAHQDPHDWITLIYEEYLGGESVAGSNLANSSALEVMPEDRASDDISLEGAVSLPSTALGHLAGISPQSLVDWTVGERHLLNHFLQSVSRSLVVVKDDENPFIGIVVPMALGNDAVRHALTALSACHLARIYPEFERNVLRHRSHALDRLKSKSGSGPATSSTLAATLLLCLLEICEGGSRRWLLYLQGARAILSDMRLLNPDKTLRFFIDLHDYLCCVGSVTQATVPHPLSQSMGVMDVGPSGMHPLFGFGSDLYLCLARINQLDIRLEDNSLLLDGESCRDIQAEARAIELALQSWAPPDGDLSVNRDEAKATAFAVQWAAMLRLREVTPLQHCDGIDRNQRPIDYILSALSLIRSGSQAESHLLFPLLMAGVFATTKASRLTLDVRLNMMKTTIGFGHIASGHQLLDQVWRRANKGEKWRWRDLVRLVAPGLILF
ncbi:fungal-specific transcription factor domain-containing protein [Colletotrichum cereale]|nr:fungal-specific transcription factor domain-containing protein [Colletotrichum cereale]